jgi:glycogen operon protein
MLLSGEALDVRDVHGEPVRDDTFVLLLNAHHEPVKFALPGKQEVSWELIIDTCHESGFLPEPSTHEAGDEIEALERSLCVLRLVKGTQDEALQISWRQSQVAEAVAPPTPPKPSPHEPIDPTTVGPRFRARTKRAPSVTDLTQGAADPKEPPVK